jgi:hypothetical protein
MEQLRNFGQVCRQHYEKFILTAALLILAGAVYFLYAASVAEREKIREIPKGFEGRKVKPIQSANLAYFTAAIKQGENPPLLDLAREHHLFNPVLWESRGGGPPQKIKSSDLVGPGAMQVTSIEPLNLAIAFGYPALSGPEKDQTVNGYTMYTTNELFARGHAKRVLRSYMFTGTNTTPAPFFIREVKGELKEPTEILAEMKEGGDKFSFAPGKPYFRVVGYEADMLYKPSSRKYTALRKGVTIDIDGQNYKVVDILPNQVVLSDDSNGKQYSITGVQRQ